MLPATPAGAQLWDDARLPWEGPSGDLPLWMREAPGLPDVHSGHKSLGTRRQGPPSVLSHHGCG